MTESSEQVETRDNPDAGRYEVWVEGVLAGFTEYSDRDEVRTFPHTEVAEEFGGRGLATLVIKDALDATREAGLQVRPVCPAVSRFIEKHPEYQGLVAS